MTGGHQRMHLTSRQRSARAVRSLVLNVIDDDDDSSRGSSGSSNGTLDKLDSFPSRPSHRQAKTNDSSSLPKGACTLRRHLPLAHIMPKSRLYRCRYCGHETDDKTNYWQHVRVHVKPEKLLTCDTCQFVTQYKHHLEYHQRNHSGYKPFKCDSCEYQCVNKSMLNSHMKSHSSVYQFQCGECMYATKYVHSLKMHLKKYSHQPTDELKKVNSSQEQEQQQDYILDLRVNKIDQRNAHTASAS